MFLFSPHFIVSSNTGGQCQSSSFIRTFLSRWLLRQAMARVQRQAVRVQSRRGAACQRVLAGAVGSISWQVWRSSAIVGTWSKTRRCYVICTKYVLKKKPFLFTKNDNDFFFVFYVYFQDVAFVDVSTVKPDSRGDTPFERQHNVSRFVLEQPFTVGGSKYGSLTEQWKRRTLYRYDNLLLF